jgi:thioredoxin 1
MNNKIILIVAVILILLVIGGFIFLNSKGTNKPVSINPTNSSQTGNSDNTNSTSEMTGITKYIAYDENAIDNTKDKRRVLFFYANWCPTCRPVDEQLNTSFDKIPEDVSVIRVNYNDSDTDDAEKELARKYGITYQHTFVQIDENGNEITKWNGGDLNNLLARIK